MEHACSLLLTLVCTSVQACVRACVRAHACAFAYTHGEDWCFAGRLERWCTKTRRLSCCKDIRGTATSQTQRASGALSTACTHACTHVRTHAHMHMHAHTHAHARTYARGYVCLCKKKRKEVESGIGAHLKSIKVTCTGRQHPSIKVLSSAAMT